jgi:hypothetical protein
MKLLKTFSIRFEINGGMDLEDVERLHKHHQYSSIVYDRLPRSIRGVAPRVSAESLQDAIDMVFDGLNNVFSDNPNIRHIHFDLS